MVVVNALSHEVVEWRPSSSPYYEVSENGDMRLLVDRSNRLAGSILKGSVKKGGYRGYKIRDGDTSTGRCCSPSSGNHRPRNTSAPTGMETP